jgi:DNA processing protein
MTFTPAERIARLRLVRSAQIGPVTFRHLVSRFGSGMDALAAVPMLATQGGGRPPVLAGEAEIRAEIDRASAAGWRHLFLGEAGYPPLLAALDNAPPVLLLAGDPALLAGPAVAAVGARNASAAACRFARGISRDLAEAGQIVVSGLARGIDTAAHEGAGGRTIAVVAGGLDVFYPPENEALQRRLCSEALVVAEQPPRTEPRARHFPYRNRIIAGLAQATLVVEAAPKSGSLITARLAAEYGRDVLAVPGSPLDPRAQGCNLLIREGATLIQTADDVLEAIGPIAAEMRVRQAPLGFSAAPTPAAADADDEARRVVVGLLGPVPVSVDELIRQSGLPPMIVQTVLLELELAARLERHAGGRVSGG